MIQDHVLVFNECPFCHKLFAAEEISRAQVDSDLVTLKTNPPRIGPAVVTPVIDASSLGGGRHTPLSPRPGGVRSRDFITYKVTYRCKHCGKEWSEVSKQVVKIPHSYVKSETEKTDADAEREEEMAREEDYARAGE